MNRFTIIGGLPYLVHDGKVYAVRWNEDGFSVGAEVEAEAPAVTYSELSIKAKCQELDSIGAEPQAEDPASEDAQAEPQAEDPALEKMKVTELKAYAAERGIDLGEVTKKAEIIAVIKAAE